MGRKCLPPPDEPTLSVSNSRITTFGSKMPRCIEPAVERHCLSISESGQTVRFTVHAAPRATEPLRGARLGRDRVYTTALQSASLLHPEHADNVGLKVTGSIGRVR